VAGQGQISIYVLIGIVWACAVAGDLTSYTLGRRLGRGFLERHGPRLKITEERLRTSRTSSPAAAGITILIGRFIGLVAAIAPFIAGASKMPLRTFLPYDVLGAACGARSSACSATSSGSRSTRSRPTSARAPPRSAGSSSSPRRSGSPSASAATRRSAPRSRSARAQPGLARGPRPR
jgi:hypothetical protein